MREFPKKSLVIWGKREGCNKTDSQFYFIVLHLFVCLQQPKKIVA